MDFAQQGVPGFGVEHGFSFLVYPAQEVVAIGNEIVGADPSFRNASLRVVVFRVDFILEDVFIGTGSRWLAVVDQCQLVEHTERQVVPIGCGACHGGVDALHRGKEAVFAVEEIVGLDIGLGVDIEPVTARCHCAEPEERKNEKIFFCFHACILRYLKMMASDMVYERAKG